MIITLTGENDVLRQQTLQQMVDAFVQERGDMALERLDGEESSYDRMHEAAQSLPFLAPRKLVVLRTPGVNKEFTEKFEDFVKDVAETNDILIVEPKLDKRLAYYKQLKKLTDFREFAVLDGNGLARYLSDYAKAQGGAQGSVPGATLGPAEARLLIDRVGPNQLTLQHEVDKLLAYAPKITRQAIELLTDRTPQSSIFELLEAAFAGNAKRAAALYAEQRAARVEPQQILAMLVWQLHILAIAKAAGSRSSATVAKDAKLSPFTVGKAQTLARALSGPRLKTLVSDLLKIDLDLKTKAINADDALQLYLLQIV